MHKPHTHEKTPVITVANEVFNLHTADHDGSPTPSLMMARASFKVLAANNSWVYAAGWDKKSPPPMW